MDSIFSEGLLGSEINVHLKFFSASLRSSICSLSELFGVSVEVSFDDHLLSSWHFGVFDRGVFIISCCFPRVEARISWLLSQSEILFALVNSWSIICSLISAFFNSVFISLSWFISFWFCVFPCLRRVILFSIFEIFVASIDLISFFNLSRFTNFVKIASEIGICLLIKFFEDVKFFKIWSYWEEWSDNFGFLSICLNLILSIVFQKFELRSWEMIVL